MVVLVCSISFVLIVSISGITSSWAMRMIGFCISRSTMKETGMNGFPHTRQVSNIWSYRNTIIGLQFISHSIGQFAFTSKCRVCFFKFPKGRTYSFLHVTNAFYFLDLNTLISINILHFIKTFTVTITIKFSISQVVLWNRSFKNTSSSLWLHSWSWAMKICFAIGVIIFPLKILLTILIQLLIMLAVFTTGTKCLNVKHFTSIHWYYRDTPI